MEQQRQLVTEIPGPRSRALWERRTRAVPAGVGTTLPIFVQRAQGGIVEDVDGNRLIDLGSGIAVTTIGNSSPRVVDAVRAQVADFTHTCFMVTPYEEYVTVCEQLNELTPGDIAFVESHRDFFPELVLIQSQRRLYPQNGMLAHVIGK